MVTVQNPLALSDTSEPEPDLMLLRPRADFYAEAHPTAADVLLVIEVCDTSLTADRDQNVPLYAAHGVPEVWLVDLEHRQVLVFSELGGGRYGHERVCRAGDTLHVSGLSAPVVLTELAL